jgi:hypothetical protein
MTMVPMAADRPRARASKAVPVFLGLTAALLVGGAIAAFMILGKEPPAGSGSGTAITVPPPTTTKAAPETPQPTTSVAPTATATATAAAAAPEVQVKIACVPGCDSLQLDGKPVEEITKPAGLIAGKHTLAATKDGYTAFEETVEVEITGTEAKLTFTRDGSPAQISVVKDITKPLDHKVALALAPVAKASGTPVATTTPTSSSTATKTSTSTSTKTKPGCKSKFGVGCK